MNAEKQQSELKNKASHLHTRVAKLREQVEGLTTAATRDMMSKVEQLETMVAALQRDAGELSSAAGADLETVRELYSVTESKLTSLEHEIDALASGNPTTVSAAVDAIVNIGNKE